MKNAGSVSIVYDSTKLFCRHTRFFLLTISKYQDPCSAHEVKTNWFLRRSNRYSLAHVLVMLQQLTKDKALLNLLFRCLNGQNKANISTLV